MKTIYLILILALTTSLFAFEDASEPVASKSKKEKDTKEFPKVLDLDNIQEAYFRGTQYGVITYKYDPTTVFKIRTRVMAKTTIILPYGEKPILDVNGLDQNFELELMKNKNSKYDLSNIFTIKTKYAGVDTTLTILTTKGKIYNFYLYSINTDDPKIPNQTVYITDDGEIPDFENGFNDLDEKDKTIIAQAEEINRLKVKLDIKDQKQTKNLKSFNIANIQLDYKFNKNDQFKLRAVFNDDEFTYFKFDDDFSIPRFYFVDEKNDKINHNFTIFENIIKVQKRSKKWSIELNGDYLEIEKLGKFDIQYSEKKLYVDMTKTKYNMYSISGDQTLKPQIIFYDNEFTYFKFDISDGFKTMPNIYAVIDGYDNPMKTERVNDYLVVKSLHDKWTLKQDIKHNCVRLER